MKLKWLKHISIKELFLIPALCWLAFLLLVWPVQGQGPPGVPATYYGTVQAGSDFVPTAGMTVTAYVNGNLCGESVTESDNSEIVYRIHVRGAGPGDDGCGTLERSVTLFVESQEMAPMMQWDNRQLHDVEIYPLEVINTPTATNTPIPTNSPTNTATATNTPTMTATPTITATPTVVAAPIITSIDPPMGRNSFANEINIYGNHFQEESLVRIDGNQAADLLTTFISATHLRALIPADQEAGAYDLIVSHSGGNSTTLSNAYTVLGAENQDLFANSYSLLSSPSPLRAGDSAQLSLAVQRQGGSETLRDVAVEFYLGNPNSGGTLIGTGTVVSLAANSSGTTNEVTWSVPPAGRYRIFAVIDPDNQVTEIAEDNNMLRRRVRVLRAAQDSRRPTIEDFTINGGASQTTDQNVELSITASDPGASSTGVQSVYVIEYEFNQNTAQWIPAQKPGWQPYQSPLNWTILPSSGLKYLQVWVADGAGNISTPSVAWINYLAPTDSLPRRSSRFYIYRLNAGESMSVTLTPISGDPDLYVWSPEPGTSWKSFNDDLAVDDVRFTAPVNGTYVVEVYAYQASEYNLAIELGSTINRPTTRQPTIFRGEKIPQSEPGLAPDEVPEEQQYAVPVAEETDTPTAITFITFDAFDPTLHTPTSLFGLLIVGLLGVAAYLWRRELLQ